jgi:hypothetical protein
MLYLLFGVPKFPMCDLYLIVYVWIVPLYTGTLTEPPPVNTLSKLVLLHLLHKLLLPVLLLVMLLPYMILV